MSLTAIYLGPKSVSLAQAKGKKLIHNAKILQSAVSHGELEEKVPIELKTGGLASLIADELKSRQFDAKEAVFCLSGKDLIIRTFEMPLMPAEELSSAINFEVKKYIPFKIEDLISDFQIKLDKSSRINIVLFIGIKKETLDRYISLSQQIKINLSSIEYSAFSLLRFLKLSGANEKGVTGFFACDLEEGDEINFTVTENGFPLFSRDIVLYQQVDSFSSLEKNSPESGLERLKTEVRVSLDYYHRKFPAKSVKKIFVLADKKHYQGIEAFMHELGLEVEFIQVDKFLDSAQPYSLCGMKSYAASLSRALGTKIRINLLASKEKTKTKKDALAKISQFSLAKGVKFDKRIIPIAMLISAAVYALGYFRLQPVRQQVSNIKATRQVPVSVSPDLPLEELSNSEEKYQKKIKLYQSLLNEQAYATILLNAVTKALPDGLWLTRFYFLRRLPWASELMLEGMVFLNDREKEFKTINDFMLKLRSDQKFSAYFKNMAVNFMNEIDFEGIRVTNFSVSCSQF